MGWILIAGVAVLVLYSFVKSKSQNSKTFNSSQLRTDTSGLDNDIIVNDEYKAAFELIEKTNTNIFITGKAGTGKSTFLDYLRRNTKKICAVVAPSGIAALNVHGKTIHSFFRFPWKIIQDKDIKKVNRPEVYKALELLIIDEISMVRADLFDGMDKFLRVNRNNPEKPFGGVQVVMIGDLYQLPPVVDDKGAADYFSNYYRTPYFFNSIVYPNMKVKKIDFQTVYRHKDVSFISQLDKIRNAAITIAELDVFNQNHLSNVTTGDSIILTPDNALANSINEDKLNKIQKTKYTFQGIATGKFDKKNPPAPMELILKQGAQIIFVKNDKDKRWYNGTLGIIDKIDSTNIVVRVGNYKYDISKERWETFHYEYKPESKSLIEISDGYYEQYPLKLAWAMTIHKSQGKTFDQVILNIGNGAFEFGQVYVALSRCRTPQGLRFEMPLSMQDIRKDERIDEYLTHF